LSADAAFHPEGCPEWKKPPVKAALSNSWRFGDMLSQGPHQSLRAEDTIGSHTGQAIFQYNDPGLSSLDKYLSAERLAAYMVQARNDKWVAIRLYERNTELSEALYGVVQGLEVSLRNSVHNLLTQRLGTPEWFDTFGFEGQEQQAIADAKDKIHERHVAISPGRVVAELGFSFWVRLTSHAYEDSLWLKHLYMIFPMSVRRKQLHERLIDLKTLRNRIAHHERIIYKRDPEKDYANLLETIGWISPDFRAWVEHTNCFSERFARRIPRKEAPASNKQETGSDRIGTSHDANAALLPAPAPTDSSDQR
jgi:hypothetical protein